jgi:accessory gene regulator protein AgrB
VTYRSKLSGCNMYIALKVFYCYVKRNAHITIINDLLTCTVLTLLTIYATQFFEHYYGIEFNDYCILQK